VYRLLQLHERSQEFIGAHDETLSVVAVCVCTVAHVRAGGTGGEPPPFWFVRLSFVESREKIDKNRTRDSNRSAGSFSLDAAVNLVMLATLDATARADVGADIGNHTALGIFFRLQVVEFEIRFLFLVLFVLHVCYLSLAGLFVLSVTPNSNRCPPVTSCFGTRSFKRINLSFLRLGL
jgi:hypothetical protein